MNKWIQLIIVIIVVGFIKASASLLLDIDYYANPAIVDVIKQQDWSRLFYDYIESLGNLLTSAHILRCLGIIKFIPLEEI